MFLFIIILSWLYPTIFCLIYLLKNRKKVKDFEIRLQFTQWICGVIALIGTFRAEGFALDELAIKCIGWNVWLAVGFGKISWLNVVALTICERITNRNKVCWWIVFFISIISQLIFYIAVISSDTAHGTKNDVCYLRHDYEIAASIFIVIQSFLIACFFSVGTKKKDHDMFIVFICILSSTCFLPGVLHLYDFMFERWWRIITILLNCIPILVWHMFRTWKVAYLFAKHKLLLLKEDDLEEGWVDLSGEEEQQLQQRKMEKEEEEEEEEEEDSDINFERFFDSPPPPLHSDEEEEEDETEEAPAEFYSPNKDRFSFQIDSVETKEGLLVTTNKKRRRRKRKNKKKD